MKAPLPAARSDPLPDARLADAAPRRLGRDAGVRHRRAAPGGGLVLLLMNIATVFPLWPGNIGLLQAAVALPLDAVRRRVSTGFAYGLVLQVVEMSVGVGVGLVMLAREGLSFASLQTMEEAEESRENVLLEQAETNEPRQRERARVASDLVELPKRVCASDSRQPGAARQASRAASRTRRVLMPRTDGNSRSGARTQRIGVFAVIVAERGGLVDERDLPERVARGRTYPLRSPWTVNVALAALDDEEVEPAHGPRSRSPGRGRTNAR